MKISRYSTIKILAILLTALMAVLPACAQGLTSVTAAGMPEIAQVTVQVMPGGGATSGANMMAAPNPVMTGATASNVMVSIQVRNFNIVPPGGATGTPGATTPAASASPTATATRTPGATTPATASPSASATMSPTATATSAATGTPGATSTKSPSPTMSMSPTMAATGTPGATTTASQGHIHYYMDTTVPTTTGVPAVTQPGTYVVSTSQTLTWTNVMPGTHIFSVQLVHNDHTPYVPFAVATAIVTIPTGAATPGATTPATSSPTATTAATGTPGATATVAASPSASVTARPSASAAATGTPGATSTTGAGRITQVSCQVGTTNPTGAPGLTGNRSVTFSIQASGVSGGSWNFVKDMMVQTDPNQPAIGGPNVQSGTQSSVTWTNIEMGAHSFSAEAVDANGKPMLPVVQATIIITVPGNAAASATGTPGATTPASPSPSATPSASPTATATSAATGTPGATATATTTATASLASNTINLTAQGLAFNLSTITVRAGAPVTVNFNNMDSGIPHNLAVYTTSAATTPIFVGNIITGPATTTYTFTAPSTPGTYFFRCDVHPTQMYGNFIVQ